MSRDRKKRAHDRGGSLRPRGREDRTVDIPRLADDEVLVRVAVALTCGTDLKVWKQGFHARMIQPPALFGHELRRRHRSAGHAPSTAASARACAWCRRIPLRATCASTAARASRIFARICFSTTARTRNTFAFPGESCAQNMLEIPDGVSFLDAAMVEPLACVLRGIHETGIKPGDTVVVIGCGPIGLEVHSRFFRSGRCA